MSRLIAERLGWTTRDQLITAVYGEKIELSTLAPLVFELASMHEPIAIDILRRGVSALVELIQCARTRVNMSPVRAATIGGLIDTSTVYRELLVAALHEADPSIEVSMPVRSAVEGALMLALKGDSGEEKEQP
jgi:N-acetylglucosamine kinase-like BadF-type ATPase